MATPAAANVQIIAEKRKGMGRGPASSASRQSTSKCLQTRESKNGGSRRLGGGKTTMGTLREEHAD